MTPPQHTLARELARELFDSMQARRRPEDVAALVTRLLGGGLGWSERAVLQRAARHAAKKLGATSMMDDFDRPIGLQHQVASAARPHLFPQVPAPSPSACDSLPAVSDFVRACGAEIHKAPGRHDFMAHRLSAELRREAEMQLSRRKYNRLFRFVARLEEKLDSLDRNWARYQCLRVGKTRLATKLTWETFNSDPSGRTQAFLAYYAARCNLRSRFTIEGQTKPFDEVSRVLLDGCVHSSSTNWFAIAHIFPDAQVLARLCDEQKGELLGLFFDQLRAISGLLREVWAASNINRQTMIVRRGNDSSTWNAAATAWNGAREGWIALLHAMGAESILDAMCPGKVLILVAGDLAWMHQEYGNGLSVDTKVWAELPLPWQVLDGEIPCPHSLVESVCARHGVDAQKGGWVAPRARGKAVPFEATPELVHGVTVASPHLANILREAKVFSGKNVQWQKLKDE